ncbi:MAG: MFS transporter [Candidatus Binatia bacterium]|nr:MFS transporter [Candidatus Binatia bacterium]
MGGPVRYRIVGMIFLLALINHIDRANISIAAPAMIQELGWDEAHFGIIFSAFLWGYTVFQLPGGYVADRLGGRLIPWLCVGWSVATLLTPLGALAFSLMLILRFLVGACEAPIVPAMSAANAAWVPRHELARAQTIIPAALNAGIMLGYPVVTAITVYLGWPWVFYLCGGVGILWAFIWLWYGRATPEEHPAVSPAELHKIQSERVQAATADPNWGPVLRSPRVWALVFSYTLWVYVMWLMAAWLPTYLVRGRGFSLGEMGWVGGIITGAALLGTVGGGWFSDVLVRRRFSVEVARRHLAIAAMLSGAPFLVAAVSVESAWACVVLLMVARLFNDAALAGYMSLPTEMSPRHLGAIWGCMSTFGSLGGMAATMLAGFLVTATGNWALPFYTAAVAIVVGALVMAVGVSARPLFLAEAGATPAAGATPLTLKTSDSGAALPH